MKPPLLALLLVLAAMAAAARAQDRLEPAPAFPDDYPLSLRFYEQETWRLLNARNAQWGVLRLPSFRPESSIVYDAHAHALVHTAVEETTLWRSVTRSTQKRIDKGHFIDIVELEEPQNYQAPPLKTTVLPISATLAGKLERLWAAALAKTEKNGMQVRDGCTWKLFAPGKRGQIHAIGDGWTRVPRLVRLLEDLEKAIVAQDSDALATLEPEVDSLQSLFGECRPVGEMR